jgi:hypothetical protein
MLRCFERARDLTGGVFSGSYGFFSIPGQGSKGLNVSLLNTLQWVMFCEEEEEEEEKHSTNLLW